MLLTHAAVAAADFFVSTGKAELSLLLLLVSCVQHHAHLSLSDQHWQMTKNRLLLLSNISQQHHAHLPLGD
jgi:hypothetical protein